ncbi:MAG: DUF3987 domain-containing protein [Azonexus sp.]
MSQLAFEFSTPRHDSWKTSLEESAALEASDDILRNVDQPVLDLAAIPPAIRAFCDNVAARIPAPIEYVVSSVLCVMGAAIGTRCGIAVKKNDPWTIVPNLWCLCVGEPSSGKSPCMSAAVSPYQKLEKELLETWSDAPRLTTNDATGEKLVEILSHQKGGLLVVRDEISGLFATFYRSGREGERQLYLQGWNGLDAYRLERIARGTNQVERLCLSVIGTIQPALLKTYLGQKNQQDGLAQRFLLLAFPEFSPRGFADVAEDTQAKATYQRVLRWLCTYDYAKHCLVGDIPYLRTSDEAFALYREWWLSNETACADPKVATYLQKHSRLVPALALIDHLSTLATIGEEQSLPPVSAESMLRAIKLADFYASTVHKALRCSEEDCQESVYDPLRQRIESGILNGFTVRDVAKLNLSGYRFVNVIESQLQRFVDGGVLRVEQTRGTGRPTRRYYRLPQD